jgi:epoxyqueuosine reductase QueG
MSKQGSNHTETKETWGLQKGKVDAAWIETTIKSFIASPANSMKNEANEPAWDEPTIVYSNGADPLYDFYKKDIGSFYVKPLEFMKHTYPNLDLKPQQLTVISWVLPQTIATKRDHRKETQWPSERWARTRIFGEEVNDDLRKYVVNALVRQGIEAVAPMLSPLWHRATSEKYGFASTWSERHAAYAAGLGTFGLSDGLITSKGKAHRVGSVVANVIITPTVRHYKDHHSYCLFYAKGTCGACIKKCPAGAISEKGHDKEKCSAYLDKTHAYVEAYYGFKGYGCGLCQVGIPCESRIPEGIEI